MSLAVRALSLLLLTAALSQASIEFRSKADGTRVYRTEALEPPPVTSLALGEPVTLLLQGADRSKVCTEEGTVGWVRNADLEGVVAGGTARHRMGNQDVTGDGSVGVQFLFDQRPPVVEVSSLDRSFTGEIAENIDREQTEMRHDEN